MKKVLICILVLALVLSAFAACGKERPKTYNEALAQSQPAVSTPEGTPVALHVVTTFVSDGENSLLEDLAEAYMKEHQNVTIEIEYLSEDIEEREYQAKQLKTAMMAGEGPDIFLLESEKSNALFADTQQAMYNGMFHEISAYYDADETLAKEELNATVMEAGMIGQGRYLLPIRYTLPVLLVNEEVLAGYGYTLSDVNTDLGKLLNTTLASEDLTVKSCVNPASFDYDTSLYLSQIIDYETDEITVTEEEVTAIMDGIRAWFPVRNEWEWESMGTGGPQEMWPNLRYPCDTAKYVGYETYWNDGELPYVVTDLSGAYEAAVISKLSGTSHSAYALPSADGNLTAMVTWWGAVGSGCDYADVAYDFLRGFLTQESQWDLNRSAASGGPWGSGYPVRTQGSAAPRAESLKNCTYTLPLEQVPGDTQRNEQLQQVTMTDADFPLLEIDREIDTVRFYGICDSWFTNLCYSLELPDSPSAETQAKDYLRQLQIQLDEG